MPWALLICIVVFVVVLLCFRMVSFASIMCMVVYPYVLYITTRTEDGAVGAYMLYAIIMACFVIFLHRKNLVRIFRHEEAKISLGKKKNDSDTEDK